MFPERTFATNGGRIVLAGDAFGGPKIEGAFTRRPTRLAAAAPAANTPHAPAAIVDGNVRPRLDCPSRAIVFGDAADENWSVAKWAKDRRAYHVFEELNTFTAVVYLKKVNHPAPSASATA